MNVADIVREVVAVAPTMDVVRMATGVAVTTSYALERHGQQTGCSQEQRECVQIHVSIKPLRGSEPTKCAARNT
jgi:hypothetical protein